MKEIIGKLKNFEMFICACACFSEYVETIPTRDLPLVSLTPKAQH